MPKLFSFALAALVAAAAFAEERAPWSYSGATGPDHWGEHAADCKDGKQQSPIDIKTSGEGAAVESSELPKIIFQWNKSIGHVLNNGHAVQVNFEGGNFLHIGEERFELTQFQIHAPSEHLIDGHAAALELQFVHKNADGKLNLLSILVDKGAATPALEPLFSRLDKPGDAQLDLPALVPWLHGYFTYEGSRTAPPCTELVHWVILRQHLTASNKQLKRLTKPFAHNARPVQPLNGRAVLVLSE